MASDGSRGPRPYTQRHARTLFVRVPADDWPLVRRGMKKEFRGQLGRQSALWANVACPTPVVAYAIVRGSYDARLMILQSVRQEELGAITPESLQREGFETFEEFRRYWLRRERGGSKFKPTRKVFVYGIRPWHPTDELEMGLGLLKRLYGDFMP